jgi:hypothetical protein
VPAWAAIFWDEKIFEKNALKKRDFAFFVVYSYRRFLQREG